MYVFICRCMVICAIILCLNIYPYLVYVLCKDKHQWEKLSNGIGDSCSLLSDITYKSKAQPLPGVRGHVLKYINETTVSDLIHITSQHHGNRTTEAGEGKRNRINAGWKDQLFVGKIQLTSTPTGHTTYKKHICSFKLLSLTQTITRSRHGSHCLSLWFCYLLFIIFCYLWTVVFPVNTQTYLAHAVPPDKSATALLGLYSCAEVSLCWQCISGQERGCTSCWHCTCLLAQGHSCKP